MIVRRMAGCGNSPKNTFLEDFCVKLFEDQPVADSMADDAIMNLVYEHAELRKDFVTKARLAGTADLNEVIINQVVSHGRGGSLDATAFDSEGHRLDYCFTFTFSSLKADALKHIKVYRQ